MAALTPKRLLHWFRSPDQVLLRRELVWVIRWFRRPLPLLALLAYLGIKLTGAYVIHTYTPRLLEVGGTNPAAFSPRDMMLIQFSAWGAWAIGFALWWTALNKRALDPIRKERLRDLVLTPIDRRQLWPALLAAPIVIGIALPILGWIAHYAAHFLPSPSIEAMVEKAKQLVSTQAFDTPEQNRAYSLLMIAWIPLGLIAPIITMMGLTAFVANRSIPDKSGVRIGISVLLGYLLVYGPGLVVLMILMARMVVRTVGGAGSTRPELFWINLSTMLAMTVFPLLISLFVWIRSIRSLRGERMWNKLCDYAAKF